jgi:transcriptional regulator with XRE-family HTH domain
LSRWMDAQSLTRDEVAARLDVRRTYLDKLCRGESRPSLELAFEIEKLTRGSVPASDWLTVPAHKGD